MLFGCGGWSHKIKICSPGCLSCRRLLGASCDPCSACRGWPSADDSPRCASASTQSPPNSSKSRPCGQAAHVQHCALDLSKERPRPRAHFSLSSACPAQRCVLRAFGRTRPSCAGHAWTRSVRDGTPAFHFFGNFFYRNQNFTTARERDEKVRAGPGNRLGSTSSLNR